MQMHIQSEPVNWNRLPGVGSCGCCGPHRVRKYGRFNHRAWSKRKTLRTHRTGDSK